MLGITELDLLATYKSDPDQFVEWIEQSDFIMIDDGCWAAFASHEQRQRRKELDRYSYIVDAILDRLHEDYDVELEHIEARRHGSDRPARSRSDYILLATDLARTRRIDRRVIGNALLEKSEKCVTQNRDRWFGSYYPTIDDTALVFLVSRSAREDRLRALERVVWAYKLKLGAKRIIGFATEPIIGDFGFSVDAVLIEQDPEIDQANVTPDQLQALLSLVGDSRMPTDTEFGSAQ